MSNLSNGPDRLRTRLPDIDFNLTSDCRTSSKEINFSSSEINQKYPYKNSILPDCQVILEDILSSGQAEKPKTLKIRQDKTHSAPSRRPFDKAYLEAIAKKDPIAWPPMKESEKWSEFDDKVFSLLVNKSSIHERVVQLELTIFSQAALLFGHLPPPKKGLRGLNRRAKRSIQLVIEKNNLVSQLKLCSDEDSRTSLLSLLDVVRRNLQNIRRGERNRKKR